MIAGRFDFGEVFVDVKRFGDCRLF